MTIVDGNRLMTTEGPSHRLATAPAPMQGQNGVWLPVTVIPATFIFCVLMFFVLRVG